MKEEKVAENIFIVVSESSNISEKASLKGEINIGENCSIAANASLNARKNQITIGDHVKIESGARIEAFGDGNNVFICNSVHIHPNAKIHNATLEEKVVVGPHSVVMDGAFVSRSAVIGENCIVVKNAIIPEGMICEGNSIYAGIPAKRIASTPSNTPKMEGVDYSNFK